ncbi:hypothetical protein EK21DRAFT_109414 [Setomelanomma holmii]|uniref:Aminoglycoside phosphotransferase domain-containing protein n=1 Tax=Setomelanomma holmii TaxID=210430 RepID=A0A9P4HH63_9PLEO|nr:hypothetical protein EK21DRAFT_109414 [Setomelanomma holmii]
MHAITDTHFKSLILMYVDLCGGLDLEDCDIIARFGCGYHPVVILRVYDDIEQGYVVNVPAIGTDTRWCDGDASNMHAEAEFIKHFRKHTSIPVPEIVEYNESLLNYLGAPYILMKRPPGVPSYEMWFEDPRASKSSHGGLRVRRDEAQAANHAAIACAHPDLKSADSGNKERLYFVGPFASSQEYMTARLDDLWPVNLPTGTGHPYHHLIDIGIRKVLDMLYVHLTISSSTSDHTNCCNKETFVLRHPDLDFQNILVDPTSGEVTGLIDWDGCSTVPRCVGYASLPDFLRRDWLPDFDVVSASYMCWQLERYQQIFP